MSRSRRRLTCVKVGDLLGLLPDKEAPQDHADVIYNQNSTLGLPETLIVTEVQVVDRTILLSFQDSEKSLDWRRFYAIYQPVKRSRVAN